MMCFRYAACRSLATLSALTLLVGCTDDAPDPVAGIHITTHNCADIGSAAEARIFDLSDGSRWMIIGRPARFVVLRGDGPLGWRPIALTNDMQTLPDPVRSAVEKP